MRDYPRCELQKIMRLHKSRCDSTREDATEQLLWGWSLRGIYIWRGELKSVMRFNPLRDGRGSDRQDLSNLLLVVTFQIQPHRLFSHVLWTTCVLLWFC